MPRKITKPGQVASQEMPVAGSARGPTATPAPLSTGAPASKPVSAPLTDAMAKAQRDAHVIESLLVPAQLLSILDGEATGLGLTGLRLHLATMCEGIKDPLEKMLLVQFVFAHHRLVQLHVSASGAKSLEASKVYNTAAARLQGELRRLALSIRAYRLPPMQKSFAVIGQQNVVANGEQHVQYIDQGKDKESLVAHDKLSNHGNPLERRTSGNHNPISEDPAAKGRGPGQRRHAATVDA